MELFEGGNVFKGEDGNPLTQRINLVDVKPTVQYLEQLSGLPLLDNMLGSTGKKPTSGDLDLAVDASKHTKDQLYNTLKSKGIEVTDLAKSGDSVHYKCPISGDPMKGYVQVDFMFGDPKWQQFALNASPDSEFKGVHRAVLLASIAKARGMKWSYKFGLVSRETNKVISADPDEIAKILIGGVRKDLASVESIIAQARKNNDYEQLVGDAREYFARDGLQFEATEVSLIARTRDRIVNLGMQVITEAARIEHPEDMIFDAGGKGALRAVNQLKQLPATAKDITIKWDGKPAIIFGRDQDGRFVLTDKSGFTAKGYNGLATSPEQLEKVMNMRGGDRTELINMYKSLWAPLEAQTPKGMTGYLKGDLLYTGTPGKQGSKYVFTPNTVTYSVDADTDLGKQIGTSKAGVAIHTRLTDPQDAGTPFYDVEQLPTGPVLFVGPKMKDTPTVDIPTDRLEQIEKTVKASQSAIDTFFSPNNLREIQMANLPALMKQYANFKVREGNFDNMAENFLAWATTKVSAPKAQRLEQYINNNMKIVDLVFKIFKAIAVIKTQIVRSLDQQGGGISATIDGESGHEGYVAGGLKYVDRLRFSKSNFAKNV
jgi:hypothetical protein